MGYLNQPQGQQSEKTGKAKSFIYNGRNVPLKPGPTGIRFRTLDDALNDRNPLIKGDTGWRKAEYEMHLTTTLDSYPLTTK